MQAQDTGRVLLVQRHPDKHDDGEAFARWEAPGGRLDGGHSGVPDSSVWAGALREFSEETGALLPEGCQPCGGWVSDDEVYEGFIVNIPHEADLALAPQTDEVSSAEWWEPDKLEDPKVRDKLSEQVDDISPMLKARWEDFHQRTDELVDAYSPEIRDALADLLSAETIQGAIRAAYTAEKASHATSPGSQNVPNRAAQLAALGALGGVAGAAVGAVSGVAGGLAGAVGMLLGAPLALGALIAILTRLYRDAAAQGASEAAAASGLHLPESLPADVARKLDTQVQVTVRGIAETEVKRIANVIQDAVHGGVPIEDTIARVDEIVHDSKRAALIAETELARAMTAAVRETYRRNSVPRVRWIHREGACELCLENAAVSPIPLGDSWPNGNVPVHPLCRCAEAPDIDIPGRRPIL